MDFDTALRRRRGHPISGSMSRQFNVGGGRRPDYRADESISTTERKARLRPARVGNKQRRTTTATTAKIIIGYLVLLSLHGIAYCSEPVIFEQFGTLVGSTSYLHVHVPLYIDAILQQHNSYHQYLTEKFISKEVIRGWLSEGLLAARNVSAKTHWRNYTSDVQLLMAALETNSAVYYEIGQLHQKDLKDIKDTIGALKNMMPQ